MVSQSRAFFMLALIASNELLFLSQGFFFNGFETQDLVTGTTADFDNELASWTMNYVNPSITYFNCGGALFAGGPGVLQNYGAYSERIYTNLPDHDIIYFYLDGLILDYWSATDYLTFDFGTGNSVILFNNFISGYSDLAAAACGTTHIGIGVKFYGKAFHQGSTLTFRLYNNLNGASSNRSFAFASLVLMFGHQQAGDTASVCIRPFMTTTPGRMCPCTAGYFQNGVGSCQQCDSSCLDCFGSTSSDCFTCNTNRYYTGSQCVACDSSCASCYGTTDQQCTTCPSNRYLIGNSCLASCTTPLVYNPSANPVCSYPCQQNQYLYPDSSCKNTCPSILNSVVQYTKNFCKSPCTTGYVYWDGICDSNCLSPLLPVALGGIQQCALPANCQPNQFLYPDGTCQDNCNSPFSSIIVHGKNLCQSPCSSGYVYWDGPCNSLCPVPFKSLNVNGIQECILGQCGVSTCIECQSNIDCPQFHYCDFITSVGKGACLSYITYSLSCNIVKSVVNGYLISVQVTPYQDISANPYDILLLTVLDSMDLNTNYTAAIAKMQTGVFQVTFQIMQQITLDPIQTHFQYSPAALNLACDLDLPKITFISNDLIDAAETLQTASVISVVILSANTIGFIFGGGIATIWSFLPENQYSYYLLYLNVNYLYHTKAYFRSLATYNLLFSIFGNSNSNSPQNGQYANYTLPARFVEEDYSPSYRQNAGQIILTETIILGAIAVITLFFKILSLPRRSTIAHRVLKTMRRVLRWNGPLRILVAYSLPAALASLIQLHIYFFDSDQSTSLVSLAATVVLLAVGLGLRLIVVLIKDIPKKKFQRIVYSEWFGTLWEDLNLHNSKTKYYYWLITMRGIVLTYVAVFLDIYPYAQIAVLILYQLGIVSLYWKGIKFQKVFETRSLNIVSFVEDVLILIMKLMILGSMVMRSYTTDDMKLINIGWAIIVPGVMIQIIQNLYATGSQLIHTKMLYNKLKRFILKLRYRGKSIRKIRRAQVRCSSQRTQGTQRTQRTEEESVL